MCVLHEAIRSIIKTLYLYNNIHDTVSVVQEEEFEFRTKRSSLELAFRQTPPGPDGAPSRLLFQITAQL